MQPIEVGVSEDGRIVRLGRNLRGETRIDLGERVILPSATDLHVHFRDPGGPGASENFTSGTVQAALGGVGLVGEMPNTQPPVTDVDILEEKAMRARGRIAVDVLLYALAGAPARVPSLAARAGAFKLYLSPTTGVEDPPSTASLGPLLNAIARTGLALSVHAEDPRLFRESLVAHDPTGWNAHRPAGAEVSAIEALLAASPPALRLHVAHVTTVRAADTVRRSGHSFEATPHHLLLSETSLSDPRGKVNPPLRSASEVRALHDQFQRGEIPCLASDHAPHAIEEKERPFTLAPSGMPGVETLLPLFLARARDGLVPLEVLLRAACDRPARLLGVPQGRLELGHRANLIAIDFRRKGRVKVDDLHAPAGWSAFERWPAVFPTHHFLDGRTIVQDGEFVGSHGGRIVRPEYAPQPPERWLPSREPD